jgi:hypothetical protein
MATLRHKLLLFSGITLQIILAFILWALINDDAAGGLKMTAILVAFGIAWWAHYILRYVKKVTLLD